MSTTKAGGKTRQEEPRSGKRLGLKVWGGHKVKAGNILLRQKGTKFQPSTGVQMGKDFTLFATHDGVVSFKTKLGKRLITVS